MNKVTVTVESCRDCPYSKIVHIPMYNLMFDGFEFYCTKASQKIHRGNSDGRYEIPRRQSHVPIPDWCPIISENAQSKENTERSNIPLLHTVYLHDLAPGDNFYFGGNKFILLEKYKSACRAIRYKSWETSVFDGSNNNNLRTASILKELERYVKYLDANSQGVTSQMMPQQIILKATDGSDDYGEVSPIAGLLTLEQYGRYRKYLNSDDTAFWLASPHEPYSSSIGEKCVWVARDGMINPAPVSATAGIRPVIMLIASTKVDTYVGKEQEDATATSL